MAEVFIATTAIEGDARAPFAHADYRRLCRARERDRFGVHRAAAVAEKADVILLAGYRLAGMRDLRSHDFVRRFRERCFVVDTSDRTLPYLPGVYVGIGRRWRSRQRVRGGGYLRVFENESIRPSPVPGGGHLYSFVGDATRAPVRRRILGLRDPRGLVVDTAPEASGAGTQAGREEWARRYADTIAASKFVLCPRGIGPSSWRLFETMKAGRAPVILSDEWLAPEGPDWGSFSVRIAESDVGRVGAILAAREPEAAAMGERALRAYEEWFGEASAYHRIVEWCLDIVACRRLPERWLRLPVFLGLTSPPFLRHHLLAALKDRAVGKG